MEEELLFGKYRILRLLANGSGGEVFLAEHRTLGERRVIKCLYRNRPFYEERRKEAQILKQLHHAAIPCIYDIEEDERATYIIEEDMNGESLNEILFRQKSLSVSFILFYSIRLCEIIEYLHGKGILYLDLKPENIIICGDQLSLVDFGGAVHREEAAAVSFGTQGFAAPEQYRGEVQERTDVYGIGRIMGVMLGQPGEKETGARKEIRRIFERCVQTLPARRYRSVAELKQELSAVYYGKHREKGKQRGTGMHTIGVVGVGEGTEAAAVCVSVAGYFSEQKGGRVACIDLSGTGVFGALYESLHGRKHTVPAEFTLRGVCYQTGADGAGMDRVLAQGFSVLVLHFGGRANQPLREFFRCDHRLVVGDTFPWRLADWYRLEERFSEASSADMIALVTGGDIGELPLKFYRAAELPRLSDPLSVERRTARFFEKLLR